MDLSLENISFARHAAELRDTWQGRALKAATGKQSAVLLSVLAHSYDDAMPVLLRVVFPGFTSIAAPFLSTAGKVVKTGAVCADMVNRDGSITTRAALYRSLTDLQNDFRRLSDRLQFTDAERTEMFAAVKRWVVCDYRIDPTMDPRDPDAKRLVVH